jgi:hypothetical protein
MPGTSILRDRLQEIGDDADKPENINLLLPSGVGRRAVCDDVLRNHEWDHRIAQANDALNEIRDNLCLRTHMYKFKDRFVWGQRPNTRSRGTIKRIDEKISISATKYETAYHALVLLSPILNETGWDVFLKLLNRDTDLRALSEAGFDQSEGTRKLSWIWLTPGASLDSDGELGDKHVHDGMRIPCPMYDPLIFVN